MLYVFLGDFKFNLDALLRAAESIRLKKNSHRNFKTNKNTDKESSAAFLGID